MNEKSRKAVRMRTGWIVCAALAILTLLEFWVGAYIHPATPYLIITAIIKAGLIMYYFMRIAQLWRRGDDHK